MSASTHPRACAAALHARGGAHGGVHPRAVRGSDHRGLAVHHSVPLRLHGAVMDCARPSFKPLSALSKAGANPKAELNVRVKVV